MLKKRTFRHGSDHLGIFFVIYGVFFTLGFSELIDDGSIRSIRNALMPNGDITLANLLSLIGLEKVCSLLPYVCLTFIALRMIFSVEAFSFYLISLRRVQCVAEKTNEKRARKPRKSKCSILLKIQSWRLRKKKQEKKANFSGRMAVLWHYPALLSQGPLVYISALVLANEGGSKLFVLILLTILILNSLWLGSILIGAAINKLDLHSLLPQDEKKVETFGFPMPIAWLVNNLCFVVIVAIVLWIAVQKDSGILTTISILLLTLNSVIDFLMASSFYVPRLRIEKAARQDTAAKS